MWDAANICEIPLPKNVLIMLLEVQNKDKISFYFANMYMSFCHSYYEHLTSDEIYLLTYLHTYILTFIYGESLVYIYILFIYKVLNVFQYSSSSILFLLACLLILQYRGIPVICKGKLSNYIRSVIIAFFSTRS